MGAHNTVQGLVVLVTQALGTSLLATIAFLLLRDAQGLSEEVREGLRRGSRWMRNSFFVTLGLLVVGGLISLVLYLLYGELHDPWIDWMILGFLSVDTLVLLLLVCQQGGLSRSMLVPTLFLVPIAHATAEHSDRMNRVAVTTVAIFVCILLAYGVSRAVDRGATRLLRGRVAITDFYSVSPAEYNRATLAVAVVSWMIIGVQILAQTRMLAQR